MLVLGSSDECVFDLYKNHIVHTYYNMNKDALKSAWQSEAIHFCFVLSSYRTHLINYILNIILLFLLFTSFSLFSIFINKTCTSFHTLKSDKDLMKQITVFIII